MIVRGRSTKYVTYGCAQHFSRGACPNSARYRQSELENTIVEKLRKEVLRSEVVEFAIQEFQNQLENTNGESSRKVTHYGGRMRELEVEIRNLVGALAKAKGSTSSPDCSSQGKGA